MFRVMIVDDEIAAREAIRASVPWADLGYELAGESADGELALDMLRESRPELLVTDIRMPYMDGLELCRRVRREMPGTRIVIVSACDEFACAREAMRLGVGEFLPKPVDAAALTEALERIAEELREEKAHREREAALRERMANSGRLLRERLLEELYGGADAEAVLRSARALRLNLTAKRYLVLLLRPLEEAGERELLALHDALEGLAASSGGTAFLRREGAEFSLLVLGDGAKHLRTRVLELAEAAAREAERAANVRIAAAVGADVASLSSVAASLADARAQLNARSDAPKSEASTPRDGEIGGKAFEAGKLENGAKEGDEFEASAAVAPGAELSRLLEADLPPLTEELRGAAPEDVDAILARRAKLLGATNWDAAAGYLCVDALTAAARIVRENRASLREITPEASRAHSAPMELLPLCAEALRRAIELRDARGSGRYGAMLRKARAYIGEHFADPNLALRDVAAHVALSNNHFCTVFAREAGVTFGEYLTSLRIRRAEELLRDTNLRTGEIAYAVGYNDPHYFSNLFKKKTGFSPRDYRRKESVKDGE